LARFLADWARSRGIETRAIDLRSRAESSDVPAGRAAFWARIPGTGKAGGAIILLSHLDVVPVDPADTAGWGAIDPFGGVVMDGAVIGRGALDAKGALVVHLAAALRLAARATPLGRDVIVLSTPDEELGGLNGAARLLREQPELVAGAAYLLTIGGGITVGPSGVGEAPGLWEVGVAEKTPCWLELRARGTAGHAAGGSRDSAVDRLLGALARVRSLPRPVRVVPEVATLFAALAPRASAEDRAGFADLETALRDDAGFRQRFLADPARAALVRNTFAITTLRGSRQINVIPGEAAAGIDARLLPGESCADFAEATRRAANDPDIQVDVRFTFASRASPSETPLMDAIRRVAARVDPGSLVVPRVGTGASDAHWFREHGIVAYGFVPRRLRPVESRRIHGSGERISEANLQFGTDVLVSLLEELDR